MYVVPAERVRTARCGGAPPDRSWSIAGPDKVRPTAVGCDGPACRCGADLIRSAAARKLAGLGLPEPARKTARRRLPESIEVFRNVKLLFFGGKGGVGKTTAAATVALRLARAEPGRAVLLLSTDPAHSLGDVFGEPVGDRPALIRRGPRNLYVRELDAAAALASRRAGIEAALNEIGAAFGAAELSIATGGRGAAELMELAPPGIDELFGLISVVEARDEYPLIVMDTAPTGHALRLLEMPDAARDWVQVLLRVLLKYRSLVRPGQLASELVDLSKSIRRLQELLRNPRDTRFIVVTRAAAVPRIETDRLLGRLRRLRLAAPAVIVNAMTLAPGRCPRCRAVAAAEQRELALLTRAPAAVRYHPDPARGAAASRTGRARSLGRLVDRERSPQDGLRRHRT